MSILGIVLIILIASAMAIAFAYVESVIEKDETLDCKIMSCDHSSLEWEIVYW